jgi:radical SAM protein with 4Fe4S-binding SPASM domain
MEDAVFSRVIEAIDRNRTSVRVVVLYHGGEPLLNKRFPDMVRRVKESGIPFVKAVSNGMHMPRNLIRELVDCGLDAIEFSIDGDSAEINNLVRRNADFDRVVENVKALVQHRVEAGVTKPAIYVSTTQFVQPDIHAASPYEASVPEFIRAAFAEVQEEIAGYKPTFAMRWPHMEVNDQIYDVYMDPHDEDTGHDCDHVMSTLTVRWNGDVVPCCYDLTSRLVLGNVCEQKLEEIWEGENYRSLREEIQNRQFNPLCGNCNVVRQNAYLTIQPEIHDRFQTLQVEDAVLAP